MEYHLNIQEREDGTMMLHADRCQYVPRADHRISVGAHEDCHAALKAARQEHEHVKPCRTCCSDCAG